MLTSVGQWIMTTGLHIAMVVVFALVVTRAIRWAAERVSQGIADGDEREPTVRSETVKHRQAVAAATSSVAIGVLYVLVALDIANQLGLPVASLVAPAAQNMGSVAGRCCVAASGTNDRHGAGTICSVVSRYKMESKTRCTATAVQNFLFIVVCNTPRSKCIREASCLNYGFVYA